MLLSKFHIRFYLGNLKNVLIIPEQIAAKETKKRIRDIAKKELKYISSLNAAVSN